MPLKITSRLALLTLTTLCILSLAACLPVNTRTGNSPTPGTSRAGSAGDALLAPARAALDQGQYAEAVSRFLAARQAAPDEATRRAAEEGALTSLSHLDGPALEQIQRQYGLSFPAPEATYFLARKAAESGDRDRTVALADYFSRYYSSHPLLPQVSALVKNLDDPTASMGQMGPISSNLAVAAILPLSGDGAQYAREIVAGLKLALGSFPAAGTLGLTLMDTRGSAEEAASLVSQAAADPKVVAVVGPFLSRESAQAAQAANRAGLPLIAISQRADLPSIGDYIFRIFLTPKHQAEAVARHAVRVQGHQSLGILYPDDNYGRPVRAAFENEARRLGAQVVVAEGYEPQTTDWTDLAARLTGGAVARKVSASYQAQTEFTALYLPDSAAPVSQIMAQLAFHDVTRMQYLGSPLWLSPDFLASSSRYTQGAVIPVAWSDLSQRQESRRFLDSFKATSGHAPDQFAAYGYDAGLAIIKALGQGADSRDGLRRALSQAGPVPGATGPFSFDHTGEYLVEPALLSVKGREFILLSEAGSGER
ncbi:MAG: penicillin-binding protein activator [Candidatus Adiutrix sp.]|jgi:ABC-type branched-subunit amino acid transport system substrate-binding protein|nr:penicillin-binding protein activator [Candidatus Adiutrix sp.]